MSSDINSPCNNWLDEVVAANRMRQEVLPLEYREEKCN